MRPLVFYFSLLLSLNLFASSECNSNQKHFIFLVHGIAGSEKTFGSMEEYLWQNLNEESSPCHLIYSFEYDTGNSTKTTQDFSNDLYLYVKDKAQDLDQGDRISFIMHSQGGLVGQLFLHNLLEEKSAEALLMKDALDAFITLGTPYWGADIASWAQTFFFSLFTKEANPISLFGKKELEQMKYGSQTIYRLMKNFNSIFSIPNLRPLALGGYSIRHNAYLGEDDNVVPIYSSNPNHFYQKVNKDGEIKTQKVTRVPYVLIPALHIKMDRPGIAYVDKSCLEKDCKYPALNYILSHLNEDTFDKGLSSDEQVELHRFRLNLFVKMPKEKEFHKMKARVFMNSLDASIPWFNKFYRFKKIKEEEGVRVYSTSINGIAKNSDPLSVSFELVVNGHNKEFQRVFSTATIQAGRHSFVEIDLTESL